MDRSVYLSHVLPEGRFIRLLTIDPATSFDAPLQCHLQVVDLDDSPNFAALSYCWGVLVRNRSVPCDRDGVLLVTPVVETALRRLRSIGEFVVWIDQTCVNQDDPNERNSQVQLMREIYSTARITLSYIGEDFEPLSELLEEVQDRASHARSERFSELAATISTNSYFCRLWIVQEVVVSKNSFLLFGRHCIPWSSLYRLHEIAKLDIAVYDTAWVMTSSKLFDAKGRHKTLSSYGMKLDREKEHEVVGNARTVLAEYIGSLDLTGNLQVQRASTEPSLLVHMYRGQTNSIDVLSYLSRTVNAKSHIPFFNLLQLTQRGFVSSDPRDQMFALLGLASDATDFPRPDYTKSPFSIFHEFTSILVAKGHGSDIISRPGDRHFGPEMPSWVPYWIGGLTDWQVPSRPPQPFSGGSSCDVGVKLTADPWVIGTDCVLLDSVTNVSAKWSAGKTWGKAVLTWLDSARVVFYNFCSEKGVRDEHFMAQDFSSLLVGDGLLVRPLDGKESEHLFILQSILSHCNTHSEVDDLMCDAQHRAEHGSLVMEYFIQMNFFMSDIPTMDDDEFMWRLITTDSGLVGVGPSRSRVGVGDRLVIFPGAPKPSILRSHKDGFKIVGQAYVRGIMHGEAHIEGEVAQPVLLY